jgi:two-component system, chemotaxis family, CheB/CheR fusion protein
MHDFNTHNEAVLQAVLGSLSDAVAAIDATGAVLFVNDAMARVLGFPGSQKIPPMPLAEALHRIEAYGPDGTLLPIEQRPLMRALRGEAVVDMELHMRQPLQGRSYDVINSAIPLFDETGAVRMAVVRMRDVTEQRRHEEALRESEQRYRALFESASDMVLALDPDLHITSVNQAAQRILGFTPEEMVGAPLNQFVDAEEAGKFRIGGTFEVALRAKDPRTIVTFEVRASFLRDAAGTPTGIHAIARDVSERKQAEARQGMLLRELQHRTKNILAVVQSLVTNTLRNSETVAQAQEALLGRLHAVATAQEFVAADGSTGAPLLTLIDGELAPFAERVRMEGPPMVVSNAFAQTFTLVIHELATNAAKYGAFSAADGTVTMAWKVEDEAGGAEPLFHLSWVERGGPPATIPKRSGFGRKIIGLLGQPTLQYLPEGLEYRVSVPMSDVRP